MPPSNPTQQPAHVVEQTYRDLCHRSLRNDVACNVMSLGRHAAGWDSYALAVLRAAAPTVATEGAAPLFATLHAVGRRCLQSRGVAA